MNALEAVASRAARPFVARSRQASGFGEWLSLFSPDGFGTLLNTTMRPTEEVVDANFMGFAEGLYLRNSVVFACLAIRARIFSEARFAWQQMRSSRPGNLFGTPELSILEQPEAGHTTGDMLAAAILDADLAGTAFVLRQGNGLRRLRPDWMTIAYGSRNEALSVWDPTAEIIGFGYQPDGPAGGKDVIRYAPDEVAVFAPTRDPLARNRGISLLTAGLREIMADTAATTHKLAYFRNAATPNLAVTLPVGMKKESAAEWIELFDQEHKGSMNAYKTIYFAGGSTPTIIGSNMESFKDLQGKAETRIAALTGMHPVIVALSEGLVGTSLGQGASANARRTVGDATLRPLWRNMCASLETIIRRPNPAARLWWLETDVAFLREDIKDQAQVIQSNMAAINSAITQGWTPESAVDAVTSADLTRLQHTGLVSVQLQPPGEELPAQAFHVSNMQLRQMLTAGWRAASAGDDLIIRHALSSEAMSWLDDAAAQAMTEFWPVEERFVAYGTVDEGQTFPAGHPLVAAYPSLFSRIEERPGLIVTKAQVTAKRTELLAAGQSAGYDSLARELNTSRDTIRRRLRGE